MCFTGSLSSDAFLKSCLSPRVFLALSICRLRKFASVFEIVSNTAVFSTRFSLGFEIHPPDQNKMLWLGKSCMNN